MKLITNDIRKRTPYLQETSEEVNPLVTAKFFDPVGFWTWYLVELDTDNDLAFGYVEGIENEIGYFSINELESLDRPYGLSIERDIYFKPKRLLEIQK